MIDGYQTTALLYTAAQLRLADLFVDGPNSADSIARKHDLSADALHRVLRGLTVLGLFSETEEGIFSLTEMGSQLRPGMEGSLYERALLAGGEYLLAWAGLADSVRKGVTPFESAFGMTAWEHRACAPEFGRAFVEVLSRQTGAIIESIAAAYNFNAIREVIDIGGGQGTLLTGLLRIFPALRGVLLERPEVAARIVSDRFRTIVGDFFEAIPSGSNLFVLKSVLHDWDDLHCVKILKNCRVAMSPPDRLLIIERLLPERATDDPATTLLDLHMLAVLGGRERTLPEFRRLAADAQLEKIGLKVIPEGFTIMEFQPAQSG